MEKYLEIGKIVSVFGLKGEVKVNPWCDSPAFICEFDTLYYKSGTPVEIERSRVSKNIAILKIKGVDTVEQAQAIRNRVLYMNRDDVELEAGCYFIQDLVGLTVKDADTDKVYGKITEVSKTGANDVYHIKSDDDKMYYIPAIPQVITNIDLDDGIMTIRPLDGLFD
ncbi:MAG: 16S rRNA processing protein RimM [Ruminococcus sp.]|nr:16S rRNA processing protein RimM [Ruminococcus sp.]